MEARIFKPLLEEISRKKQKGMREGQLYGLSNSKSLTLITTNPKPGAYKKLGVWASPHNEIHVEENSIALFTGKEPECYRQTSGELQKLSLSTFDYENLFARNFDIYADTSPRNKSVVIIGGGSVGGLCATQLAKSGVENITLVDNSKAGLANIARQQADLQHLDLPKTEALKGMLSRRNPHAKITCITTDIIKAGAEQLSRIFKNKDLAIITTDSATANRVPTLELIQNRIPAVYISCYERAASGEIIFYIPDITPCYICTTGFRRKQHIDEKLKKQVMDYSEVDDPSRLMAEPGLAINIDYITNLGMMYAMALLLGPESNHYQTLIEPLLPDSNIIFVNSGSSPHLMFQLPFEVVYGKIKRKTCPACQREEFEQNLLQENSNDTGIQEYLNKNINTGQESQK